jgi:hypothetical protein
MTNGLNNAARDDRNWFKIHRVHLLAPDPNNEFLQSSFPVKTKSNRGFNNKATALLLCPQSLVQEYWKDCDEYSSGSLLPAQLTVLFRYRAHFLDGTIRITANKWPHFLYPTRAYDPNDIDRGLLQGYLLVRVSYFFVFTF